MTTIQRMSMRFSKGSLEMKNRAKISLLSVIAALLVQGCTYKKADGTYNEGALFSQLDAKVLS